MKRSRILSAVFNYKGSNVSSYELPNSKSRIMISRSRARQGVPQVGGSNTDVKNRLFYVLFISVFATMLGLGIVSPLLPIYADNLGATGFWLGIVFSGFAAARMVFMPIVGKVSDRSGRKKFIVAGLLAYAFISLGYVMADTVYLLTAVRLLHGIASAMVVPVAMAYIGDISEKGEEGSYMAKFQISFFLGMGSGPFLGGILNDAFGFSSAFYVMAGLSTFAFLVILMFLPETNKIQPTKKNETEKRWVAEKGDEIEEGDETEETGEGEPANFWHVFSHPVVLNIVIFTALNAMVRGALFVFMPLFAPEISVVPSQVGLILSVTIFLMALLQVPFGKMADRGNMKMMIIIGSMMAAISLVIVPFTESFGELFLASCVNGLGSSILIPAIMTLTVKVGKKVGMGSSMSAYNSAMSIGMITAPLLGGLIMDQFSIDTVFFLGGMTCTVATVVAYLTTRNGLGTI